MQLEKGKYYKFAPYGGEPDKLWWMKYSGAKYDASFYIGTYKGESGSRTAGYNGHFSHGAEPFIEITDPLEIAWLESCEKEGSYIPRESFNWTGEKNNYQIY